MVKKSISTNIAEFHSEIKIKIRSPQTISPTNFQTCCAIEWDYGLPFINNLSAKGYKQYISEYFWHVNIFPTIGSILVRSAAEVNRRQHIIYFVLALDKIHSIYIDQISIIEINTIIISHKYPAKHQTNSNSMRAFSWH